jgi:hypothetical protein
MQPHTDHRFIEKLFQEQMRRLTRETINDARMSAWM